MRLTKLRLSGFRCFGPEPTTVDLDPFTCLVGPNASGKTSAMLALARLFGETRALRLLAPTDFHLAPGEKLRDQSARTLWIEAWFSFPDVATDEVDEDEEALDDEGAPEFGPAVAETFSHMTVEDPDGDPFCRIRLRAVWTNDGTLNGDIEQSTSWVRTSSDDPEIIAKKQHKLEPLDRGRIRLVYVPAARDPSQQIRSTTETAFGRLLAALAWAKDDRATLDGKISEVQDIVAGLTGVGHIGRQVQSRWSELHDGLAMSKVTLRCLDQEPEQLLKQLVPVFEPGEGELRPAALQDLSDGQRSLFSLALSMGLHEVERTLTAQLSAEAMGFDEKATELLPVLTLFAVEEPENHLSPHYLGRIILALRKLTQHGDAQVLVSSHSPAILGRVEPDHVRYFLGHERTNKSQVLRIPLPADEEEGEAYKFVREAVRAYPELYFSRLVVLGEGPSEQIVLRRLFEAKGWPLDAQFISVVPLGGRHVNHFWRLLSGLGIPYLTLLDLDREKDGAGWGRIQYVRDNLLDALCERDDLSLSVGSKTIDLRNERFDTLHQRAYSKLNLLSLWTEALESYGVFFSGPLDLDFSMLASFESTYQSLAPLNGGPRMPEETSTDYEKKLQQRVKAVLGEGRGRGNTYTRKERKRFPWYKYLFVDGSKPVMHMRALLQIDDEVLLRNAPPVLLRLVAKAGELLGCPSPPAETGGVAETVD